MNATELVFIYNSVGRLVLRILHGDLYRQAAGKAAKLEGPSSLTPNFRDCVKTSKRAILLVLVLGVSRDFEDEEEDETFGHTLAFSHARGSINKQKFIGAQEYLGILAPP